MRERKNNWRTERKQNDPVDIKLQILDNQKGEIQGVRESKDFTRVF